MKIKKYRALVYYAIMLCFVCLVSELLAFIFINHVYNKNFTVTTYKEYKKYLNERDEILGWPSEAWLKAKKADVSGARFSPAFPEPVDSCVSLYGDSFRWSDEVDDVNAWGNRLAEILGCRVSNFGVSGYGTDQSYLRFSYNFNDKSKVVILNHMTGDIIRNVNQWRTFVSYPPRDYEWRVFKPRFILNDAGELQLITLPDYKFDELYDVSRNPSRYMKHDYLAPDGELPPWLIQPSFPYIKNVLDIIHEHLSFGYWNDIKPIGIGDYYNKDHESNAYNVTKKIILKFNLEASKRGKTPIVFFLPHRSEIYNYIAEDKWYSQGMINELRMAGVNVINYGEYMIEKTGKDHICQLFIKEKCAGHFNNEGYRLLAEFASGVIRDLE
jgi:hypothetical protein